MPATFQQQLEASISYLEDLKEQGTRYVPVRPETLEGLSDLRAPVEAPRSAVEPALPSQEPVLAPEAGGSARGAAAPLTPSYDFEPAVMVAATRATPGSAPVPDPAPADAADAAVEREEAPVGEVGRARVEVLEPGQTKAAAMNALRERALLCVKCPHLVNSRKHVVFGVGSIDAELMFVGEAPGADEDEVGEPFVGKAGQLLTRIIETMGLTRDQVYIANILKCRPDTPGQRSGNRKPTGDEMKTCSPYLHAQVDLIRPKALVALGATATEGLLGPVGGITRLRGSWQTFRDIPLMPTYHPAYLLRNQALQEKRKVWEDMLQVMETLGLPVTDKHRGYFLQR